jgi:hypothetical protein
MQIEFCLKKLVGRSSFWHSLRLSPFDYKEAEADGRLQPKSNALRLQLIARH